MSSETFQCIPPEDDRVILDLDDWKFQLNGEVPQAWIPNQKFLSKISPEEPVQIISQRFSFMLDWNFEPEKLESHNTGNIEKNSSRCQCPNCKEGGINRNKAITSDKRIHMCHIKNCGKSYKRAVNLRDHIRSHNGERPYLCPVMNCGKKFVRSDELRRHGRTHTGEKGHLCKICGKGFSRSDHRKKHEITHIPKSRRPGKNISSLTTSDTSTAMIGYRQHKQLKVDDNNRQLPMQHQTPRCIRIPVPDAAQPNTFVEITIPEMILDSFENLTPTPEEQQKPPDYDVLVHLPMHKSILDTSVPTENLTLTLEETCYVNDFQDVW